MDFEKVRTFVNYGNQNIHYKGRLLFTERFLPPMVFFIVVLIDDRFSGGYPWLMRTFYASALAGICILEYWIVRQHKRTNNDKWVLLQTAVLHLVSAISFLFVSESFDYDLSPFSNYKSYFKIIICVVCFFMSNFIRALRISKGSYIRLSQRAKYRWNLNSYEYATIGILATTGLRSLEKTFGFTSSDAILVYVCFAFSASYLGMTGGFLKFYYANKYNIDVIPTWIEKNEDLTRRRFQYETDAGDRFYVILKENRDAGITYTAELYHNDLNGSLMVIQTNISSISREAFHVETIMNERRLVCYELSDIPFGKLSDGRFVDFRRIQLEGEPNSEIVWIGETLIQQNIRWFDDFGEYLVKSGSQIGIETTKRYQDKNFTEVEIQQIEEHSLDANQIAEWSKEILLSKEKGVDDL